VPCAAPSSSTVNNYGTGVENVTATNRTENILLKNLSKLPMNWLGCFSDCHAYVQARVPPSAMALSGGRIQ